VAHGNAPLTMAQFSRAAVNFHKDSRDCGMEEWHEWGATARLKAASVDLVQVEGSRNGSGQVPQQELVVVALKRRGGGDKKTRAQSGRRSAPRASENGLSRRPFL